MRGGGTTHLEFGDTELVSRLARLLGEFGGLGVFVFFEWHHFVFWIHYLTFVFDCLIVLGVELAGVGG